MNCLRASILFSLVFPLLGSILIVPERARAQTSQFYFDLSGSLQAQTAEIPTSPQIIGQPQPQIVQYGGRASFSVIVADARGMSYQWLFNGNPISGATADTLLLTNVSGGHEGLYSVSLQNSVSTTTSAQARLYLDADADGLPDSWEYANFGGSASTYGDADGDGVSNLQEFYDGTNPTDAASALYRITLYRDGGRVQISPNQTMFTKGQVVTLTAIGTNDVPFHAWTGDITTRSNSITLTLNSNLVLFARFQPFTLTWTNAISGNWDVTNNWTPNLVPSTNEDAFIAKNVTVTENDYVDLHRLTLNDGTLVVNGWLSAMNMTLGGVIAGTGQLALKGQGIWSNGRMMEGGKTMIAPGATLNINNSSDLIVDLGRGLDNAGTINWSGGAPIELNFGPYTYGGYITNEPGAIFNVLNPQVIYNVGGDGVRFDNAGTLHLPGGVTTFSSVPLINRGLVDVSGGTFLLNGNLGGGTNTGTINVAAGAALNLADGAFNSSAGSTLTGAGTLQVSGGTHTFTGLVALDGINLFTGGTVFFNGPYLCTNGLSISGAWVAFNGPSLVVVPNLTLNGTLAGSQNVMVSNTLTWNGGRMTDGGKTIIPPGATLNINNSGDVILDQGRGLDNAGTVNWSGGAPIGLNYGPYSYGGYITNEPGGLFKVLNPQAIYNVGGGGVRFDNAGSVRLSGGGTTTFNSVPLYNHGIVDVVGVGGTFALNGYLGGGTNEGVINVASGNTFNLGDGAFISNPGSTLTGAGKLQVSGGTHTFAGLVALGDTNLFTGGAAFFNGPYLNTNSLSISGAWVAFNGPSLVVVPNLTLNGTLAGSQNVMVSNTMTWIGGRMTEGGKTIIAPGATLNINNSGDVIVDQGRGLDNAGTVNWLGVAPIGLNYGPYSYGGYITNEPGAVFTVLHPGSIYNVAGDGVHFDNAGTLRLPGGGTTTLSTVPLNNSGLVDLHTGALFVNNGYVSTSSSVLNSALAGTSAGVNYGQLKVSGTVTLAGTVNVSLVDGYVPATNDVFTLVTSDFRNGTFSNFLYPSAQASMTLANTATAVIATVTNVLVTPGQTLPMLGLKRISTNAVLLSWSTNYPDFQLEYKNSLTVPNWTVFSTTPGAAGPDFTVTNSIFGAQQFFRLRGN